MTETAPTQAECRFRVQDTIALADPDGVLVVPEARLLVVSDLHFEKGSSFAAGGQMLPPYDTRTTLRRLGEAIDRHQPQTVIALGDSFHDLRADQRMHGEDADTLAGLVRAMERWIWIEGNHDPGPVALGGAHLADMVAGGLVFRHIATPGGAGEVSGHYHHKARVAGVSRRCFLLDRSRLILPAYGTYTGGLWSHDPALSGLMADGALAIVTGRVARAMPMPR